jgi:ABC-type sugar transport system permease subunit
MGLASATAVILFVIIFVFTLAQRRLVGERADT